MLKRFLPVVLIVLGLFAAAPAHAGGCGPSNPNCIVPTAPQGTSNNQAASTAFVQGAVSGEFPGGSIGQQQYKQGASTFGGFTQSGDVTVNTSTGVSTIQPGVVNSSKIAANGVANSNINPGAANTFKASLNGSATSDIALTACSLVYQVTAWVSGTGWQCNFIPVIPSRTIAASLNLSAFVAITTQGYALPGDGGGATFKNIFAASFLDSQVATGTISAAGTAYTNGTYPGVTLTGGSTCHGLQATIVVSGGVVSSVTIVGNGGNACTVGDVLTTAAANIGGTGSGFTWTVSTVTTATCSFIDSVSTHFQMVVDQGNFINVRQCGAKMDWNATAGDAGSTNDTTAIQNALNFAANTVQPTVDGGGVAGQTVLLPFGNTLSGALTVPFGVRFTGQNAWSSQIKFTDAMGPTVIPVTLCDSTTHLACFGTHLENMTLRGGSGTASSNVPMVFSNNLQQMNALWRVAFYPGQRGCLQYDTGFGGAAQVGFVEIECTMSSQGYPGFNFTNVGTTLIYLRNVNAEFGGSGVSANGVQALGGFLDIDNFHTEGVSTGINWNNTGGTTAGALRIHNVSGGAHCTNLVLKQSGSTASDVIVGMAVPNGCTNTVNNGGTLTTTTIVADTLF